MLREEGGAWERWAEIKTLKVWEKGRADSNVNRTLSARDKSGLEVKLLQSNPT